MANDISVSELTGNIALAKFQNNNSSLMTANRSHEVDFQNASYRPGDFINIRKRNRFLHNEGRISIPRDVQEQTVPITLLPEISVNIPFTQKELTTFVDTDLERFGDRYVSPAIDTITKAMELKVCEAVSTSLNYTVGTAGSQINSWGAIDIVGAKMQEQAMPLFPNAYVALDPRNSSALKSSATLQNSFNDTLNTDISLYSKLGRISYFDIFTNQSIRRHTTGSLAGSPVVNGAVSTGSMVVLSGATPSATNVFRAGDVVSFVGVNSVNPVGNSDTGQLMQFTVQADADATAGGAVTITISPAIDSDPASPWRNVTAPIANGVAVSIYGVVAPGTPVTYVENFAYSTGGLDMVCLPLYPIWGKDCSVVTDPETGISLRVVHDGDTINGLNYMRIDALFGFVWHQDYAVKLIA